MKTFDWLKQILVAGLVALTLGFALVPRAEASAPSQQAGVRAVAPRNGSIKTDPTHVLWCGGKDGEETHG